MFYCLSSLIPSRSLTAGRKRRLSLSASSAAINTTEIEAASPNSVAMYRSEEIEAAPNAVPLPFPDAKVRHDALPIIK